MTIQLLILRAFISSVVVSFLVAAFGGIFIAPPKAIASHLSVAFYMGGAFTAFTLGSTLAESIVLSFVGAIGGVAGWLIYGWVLSRQRS